MHDMYTKGRDPFGKEWLEWHSDIMIVVSEAVLPLSITAILTAGGEHESEHAE